MSEEYLEISCLYLLSEECIDPEPKLGQLFNPNFFNNTS